MAGRNRRFILRASQVFVLGLCSASLAAQVASNPTPPSTSSDAQQSSSATGSNNTSAPHRLVANSNVKLGVGDLIDVNVFGVPDLTTKTRISSTGDIYLPLIDYVHIADLSLDEAQELIQKRLEDGGFVRNPHVTLFIEEAQSQAITMVGELAHPGPYTISGNRTLYDMISAAGGLSDRAGRVVTIVHRDDPDHKIELQLSPNLAEDTQNNVDVRPGDTIIVSRAGIVYVVGDVQHPSGFLIEDSSLTVLKALALAGGSNRTASLNKTRILRQTPNGVKEIPIPMKKILYAKAPDVPLVKGDVLFVPGSSAKAAAYRTADAAMIMSSALAVVAVHP
ncbi:MAG TPA: polysaccharide biosynthesis/export family protein [Terriglobales bacterium]|nr:polysaccharide biosynthesis/export family protein [Terriglobales bacterium]